LTQRQTQKTKRKEAAKKEFTKTSYDIIYSFTAADNLLFYNHIVTKESIAKLHY